MIVWDKGKPSYQPGTLPKGPDLFDAIDLNAGTARMLGNVGSGQVRAWATGEGLQQTMTGNEIVTTVFGVPIDTEARGAAFPFVNVAPRQH